MKNLNIINKKGIKLNTANKYVDDDINVGLTQTDKNNLVAENIKSGVEILGVVGSCSSGGNGASLNLAYGTTPPADTSKIWLQCAEPQAVEVQNYLGECAVGEVANYGVISNPVDGNSDFYAGYYSSCYIGNNQIAIVGYGHIRIYDVSIKSYIADYTISVAKSNYFRNVIYKNNILYFAYNKNLYSYDLSTQTSTNLFTSSYSIRYIFFSGDNTIDYLYDDNNTYSYHYRYNLTNNTHTKIFSNNNYDYGSFRYLGGQNTIKTNNYIYSFLRSNITTSTYQKLKYNLKTNKIEEFKSWNNFVTSLGVSYFNGASAVYDGERYIYIIGGGYTDIGYNNIIKYDTFNDNFEMLDQKLLKGKYSCFSLLIDNRVYMFGGLDDTSNNKYGRPTQIDYFDLSYPLTQNNAIITTNTINTDNNLPLINTNKLKLNSNIASAYKGNADNLAEKVNAYYWDGNKWVGINCEDYYFEWSTIPNQTVSSDSSVTIDLSSYCTNNTESEAVFTARESGDVSYFSLVVSGTQLTISPAVSSAKTSTIYVTATVNEKAYTTSFNVTVGDLS